MTESKMAGVAAFFKQEKEDAEAYEAQQKQEGQGGEAIEPSIEMHPNPPEMHDVSKVTVEAPQKAGAESLVSKRVRNADAKLANAWTFHGMTDGQLNGLRDKALEVRLLNRITHAAAYRIGMILEDIGEKIDKAAFVSWVEHAAGLKKSSAYRYRSLFKTFGKDLERLPEVPLRDLEKVTSPKIRIEDQESIKNELLQKESPDEQRSLIKERLAAIKEKQQEEAADITDDISRITSLHLAEFKKANALMDNLVAFANESQAPGLKEATLAKAEEIREALKQAQTSIQGEGEGDA